MQFSQTNILAVQSRLTITGSDENLGTKGPQDITVILNHEYTLHQICNTTGQYVKQLIVA